MLRQAAFPLAALDGSALGPHSGLCSNLSRKSVLGCSLMGAVPSTSAVFIAGIAHRVQESGSPGPVDSR